MSIALFPEELGERQTEERSLRVLVTAARRRGYLAYHTYDTRIACRSCGRIPDVPARGRGFPDLVIAKAPRVLFLELKGPAGRVTADQQLWIDELRNCGQDARVVRPADVGALVDLIAGRA